MMTDQFVVTLKMYFSGYANQTASMCDDEIAAQYEYNVTGSTCTNTTSLNICDDRTELVFNYTLCSDVMAYSGMTSHIIV